MGSVGPEIWAEHVGNVNAIAGTWNRNIYRQGPHGP